MASNFDFSRYLPDQIEEEEEKPLQPAGFDFSRYMPPEPELEPALEPEEEPGLFTNAYRKAKERGTELVGNLYGGFETLGDFAGDRLNMGGIAAVPGEPLSDEPAGYTYLKPEEWAKYRDQEDASMLLSDLQQEWKAVDFGSADTNYWEDMKNNPGLVDKAKNLGAFAVETGIASLPDMAGAVALFPAWWISFSEQMAQERAVNDGRTEPTEEDWAIAGATTAVIGAMERFGFEQIAAAWVKGGSAFTKILRAAVGEGSAEFVQEQMEYGAETLGTKTGAEMTTGEYSLASLERGAQGAVGGVTVGTTLAAPGAAFSGGEATTEDDIPSPVVKPAAENVNAIDQELERYQESALHQQAEQARADMVEREELELEQANKIDDIQQQSFPSHFHALVAHRQLMKEVPDTGLETVQDLDGSWVLRQQSMADALRIQHAQPGLDIRPAETGQMEVEEIPTETIEEPAPTTEGIEVTEIPTEDLPEGIPQIGVGPVVADEEIEMKRGPIYPGRKKPPDDEGGGEGGGPTGGAPVPTTPVAPAGQAATAVAEYSEGDRVKVAVDIEGFTGAEGVVTKTELTDFTGKEKRQMVKVEFDDPALTETVGGRGWAAGELSPVTDTTPVAPAGQAAVAEEVPLGGERQEGPTAGFHMAARTNEGEVIIDPDAKIHAHMLTTENMDKLKPDEFEFGYADAQGKFYTREEAYGKIGDVEPDTAPAVEPETAPEQTQDQPGPQDLMAIVDQLQGRKMTPAMQEANNYKKGDVKWQELDLRVETVPGEERVEGKPSTHFVGDIQKTKGADGDKVDVILNKDNKPNADSPVFVVNQYNPETGAFDEHKVMLGFGTKELAKEGYLGTYDEEWFSSIHRMPRMSAFKLWLEHGDNTTEFKPVEWGRQLNKLRKQQHVEGHKAFLDETGKKSVNYQKSAAERYKASRKSDARTDDLITFLRKEGGINMENQSDIPAGRYKGVEYLPKIAGLPGIDQFGDKGMNLDRATKLAWENDYIEEDNIRELVELMYEAEGGPVYSRQNTEYMKEGEMTDEEFAAEQAEQDAEEARIAEEAAATEPEPAPETPPGFPEPNEHGVYTKEEPSLEFQGAKGDKVEAQVFAMEIAPGVWISSESIDFKQGNMAGRYGPLSSGPTYGSEGDAIVESLKVVKKFAQEQAKKQNSPWTDRQGETATKLAVWAQEEMEARGEPIEEVVPEEQESLEFDINLDDVLASSQVTPEGKTPLDQIKLTAEAGDQSITHTAKYWVNAIDKRIRAVNKLRGCA